MQWLSTECSQCSRLCRKLRYAMAEHRVLSMQQVVPEAPVCNGGAPSALNAAGCAGSSGMQWLSTECSGMRMQLVWCTRGGRLVLRGGQWPGSQGHRTRREAAEYSVPLVKQRMMSAQQVLAVHPPTARIAWCRGSFPWPGATSLAWARARDAPPPQVRFLVCPSFPWQGVQAWGPTPHRC